MAADHFDTEIAMALAILHGHLSLAQALVDMFAALQAPEHLAWARAELDQLQATGRDLSSQHRPGGTV